MASQTSAPTASNRDSPLGKDSSQARNGVSNKHPSAHTGYGECLRPIETTGSISISAELFEKIYLSPHNQVNGELRKIVGNPALLALVGFLVSLSPLSCVLMGWRGAGGSGASGTATYFFFGGILMLLGGIGEWIIGNTFPFVVFCSFGAFWMSFGGTLQPFFNAYGAYSTNTGDPALGLETVEFNSGFAFFLLAMALLSFMFLILSLRTNAAFVVIFTGLVVAFGSLAGAYWHVSNGNTRLASGLTVAGGAAAFVTCTSGWWILFAIMLETLCFPFQLPVGDLSTMIKSGNYNEKNSRSNV